jgi:membrane-associated phospholipid phosphatase
MPTRVKSALGLAGVCVALLILLWYAAFHVGVFQRADRQMCLSFFNLTFPDYRHRVHEIASFVVSLCDPSRFAYLALLPVAVALARRRAYEACAVAVLLVGAGAAALLLKHLLPQPRVASFPDIASLIPYPRFPSGHATAAMSLVLALVFVAPARLRPVVAGLGAVFAAAVGYSLLAIGSHFPSDVFGGFLVAAAWCLMAVGMLRELERRLGGSPGPTAPITVREALAPPAVALLAILMLAVIVVLSDPHAIVSYTRAHGTLVLGIAVIAALSATVSTGVLLVVRRELVG